MAPPGIPVAMRLDLGSGGFFREAILMMELPTWGRCSAALVPLPLADEHARLCDQLSGGEHVRTGVREQTREAWATSVHVVGLSMGGMVALELALAQERAIAVPLAPMQRLPTACGFQQSHRVLLLTRGGYMFVMCHWDVLAFLRESRA